MIESFPAILGYSLEENIEPTILHIVRDWQISLDEIDRYPRLIGASLNRVAELFRFLQRLEFDVNVLPPKLKPRVVSSVSSKDVIENLKKAGFETEISQKTALADPKNWKWIFKKTANCDRLIQRHSPVQNPKH